MTAGRTRADFPACPISRCRFEIASYGLAYGSAPYVRKPLRRSPGCCRMLASEKAHRILVCAFDPTLPEALEEALKTVRTAVQWGYEFIKHDYTTYELFGRWGFAMHADITTAGWHFHDRSRTNAEIIRDLYQAIRSAAGETTMILGCNTVGHLAAGIFESQRIADDTSGRDWERTRRFGVNGLAHRIAQHRTFSHIDPDCVAITPNVGWRETSEWMDVVARTGTSLFFSPEPTAITPAIKSAMKDAMLLASQAGQGYPEHPTRGTTPTEWQFSSPRRIDKTYNWCGPEEYPPSRSSNRPEAIGLRKGRGTFKFSCAQRLAHLRLR